jgi:hypothetical protein
VPAKKPPRWTEYVDVDALIPDERNPKNHADKLLDESLARFGYTEQVMIDERTGKLVAGHGRRELVLRARDTGADPPDGIVVTAGRWRVPVQRGWASANDDESLAYLVASNRLVETGGWEQSIASTVQQLSDTALGLVGTGYTESDLQLLLAEAEAITANEGDDPDAGVLLAASDVTLGEPQHTVERGDVWNVGKHVLVCADVMTEHALWAPLLAEDVLFCPYPGPYVALAGRIDEVVLLLVQPDTYLAGHVVDKFAAVNGEDEVNRR